jgi:Helix-turn-helix domain
MSAAVLTDAPRPVQAESGTIKLFAGDAPLTDKAFAKLPKAIALSSELSPGAKLLYAILVDHAREKGRCFPGQDTLAKELGRSERTVRRLLLELKEAGQIGIIRRGLSKTNVYEFNPDGNPVHECPLFDQTGDGVRNEETSEDGPDRKRMSDPDRTKTSGPERTKTSGPLDEEDKEEEDEGARAASRASGGVLPKTPPKTPLPDQAKKPDPNHRPLVGFFCTSWREKYGADFPFNSNPGGNAKAAAAILRAAKGELVEAKRIVRDYFDDPDQWIAANKHPLLYLAKYVQRYIGNGEPLVNEHGLYTRPRPLTPEEISRLEEEAKADAGKQGPIYA